MAYDILDNYNVQSAPAELLSHTRDALGDELNERKMLLAAAAILQQQNEEVVSVDAFPTPCSVLAESGAPLCASSPQQIQEYVNGDKRSCATTEEGGSNSYAEPNEMAREVPTLAAFLDSSNSSSGSIGNSNSGSIACASSGGSFQPQQLERQTKSSSISQNNTKVESIPSHSGKERRVRGIHKQFGGEGFYKTKLCRFFDRGQCRYGAQCSYAHCDSEIRQALNLRKTRLCAAFRRGQCNFPNCSFAHGHAELRSTQNLYKTQLCLFWLAGRCKAGWSCRHAHGDGELVRHPPLIPPLPLPQRSPHDGGTAEEALSGALEEETLLGAPDAQPIVAAPEEPTAGGYRQGDVQLRDCESLTCSGECVWSSVSTAAEGGEGVPLGRRMAAASPVSSTNSLRSQRTIEMSKTGTNKQEANNKEAIRKGTTKIKSKTETISLVRNRERRVPDRENGQQANSDISSQREKWREELRRFRMQQQQRKQQQQRQKHQQQYRQQQLYQLQQPSVLQLQQPSVLSCTLSSHPTHENEFSENIPVPRHMRQSFYSGPSNSAPTFVPSGAPSERISVGASMGPPTGTPYYPSLFACHATQGSSQVISASPDAFIAKHRHPLHSFQAAGVNSLVQPLMWRPLRWPGGPPAIADMRGGGPSGPLPSLPEQWLSSASSSLALGAYRVGWHQQLGLVYLPLPYDSSTGSRNGGGACRTTRGCTIIPPVSCPMPGYYVGRGGVISNGTGVSAAHLL